MVGSRDGFAKVIVTVVILLVAVGAVLYFTSDVWRTRIKVAADQYAHWTPENIAKDPENYLNFCEQQANAAMQNLKASEIAIAQNRARLEGMVSDAAAKVAAGEKALDELKTEFGKAEQANSWPITWQGGSRDKDWTKRQIVSLYKQVEAQKGLREKVDAGLKKLDAQVVRIQDGKAKTQEQLAEIKTSREILKVQKITDDLTQRLASIKSVLQTTVSTASESTGVISLDQLAAQTVSAVDESEFKKIMGK